METTITTITNNIEFIIAFIAVMSVPAFIMVVTSLIKQKTEVYTPFVAVAIGIVFGLMASWLAMSLVTEPLGTASTIVLFVAGIVQGAISGAAAVGIKVVADGKAEEEDYVPVVLPE